jgi:Na+/H+ antiporter NhaD/arsenite permease-like protein
MVLSLTGALIVIFVLLFDPWPLQPVDFQTIMGFLFGTPANGYINFHSILFILGMMILLAICQETGVFSYIAFKVVQKTGGNEYLLLFIMSLLSFVFSAILNNILTVLLLIPLTITICKILRINPIPFILAEAMVTNLGGILFSISSIPNLLITQSIDWTFGQFFLDVGLFAIILLFITFIFLAGYNKRRLETPSKRLVMVLREYNAWVFVKDRNTFYKSFIVLIGTITLVIILPFFIPIEISLIAMSGGLILVILVQRKDIPKLMKNLDIQLIFYLLGIFLISDALEFTGMLDYISQGLIGITGGNLIITAVVVLWVSGGLSSVIDNAPITKILIPVVKDVIGYIPGVPVSAEGLTIFSALAYGTNLGDNLAPTGDNTLVMQIVDTYHTKKISLKEFFQIGLLTTTTQLIAITVYLVIRLIPEFLFIGILIIILIAIILLVIFYTRSVFNYLKKLIRKEK